VVAAASDPETQRWLPLPRPYSADDARWFIHTFAAEQQRSGDGLVRAVEVAGRLVGAIDLKKTDWRARTTEVGYWAAPWARGEGHTTRAVRLLATWALTDQGLERVELLAATGNEASSRVAAKAGFQREGVARNAGVLHEGRVDLTVWSLVPADLIPTPDEASAEPAPRG
jgi:RimJ/RimL family protein N-acetyltransferase